jgi:hypothetical protein
VLVVWLPDAHHGMMETTIQDEIPFILEEPQIPVKIEQNGERHDKRYDMEDHGD